MNDSDSELNTCDLSGRVVVGTVTKVLPHGALLRLSGVSEIAFLHISQVSSERIALPLTNTLKEGDTVEVSVKWFDKNLKRWETSHKELVYRKRWESLGLTIPGTRFFARVLTASELGAVVDVEGSRLRIRGSTELWNAYRVLYEADYVKPDKLVEVVFDERWLAQGRFVLRLYLGEPEKLPRGSACDGTVILARRDVIHGRTRNWMNDALYAMLPGGEIAFALAIDLVAAEKTFPIGSTIPLRLGRYEPRHDAFAARIDWEKLNLPVAQEPELGTVLDVRVVTVRPAGAKCQIADGLTAWFHHSTIVQEDGGNARRHIRVGDLVRAIVEPRQDVREDHDREQARNLKHDKHHEVKFQLRFLQLVDRVQGGDATDTSDELIDLRASRRLGRPSGFQRDQDFRWRVLEAFDHRCCVCGVRHVFGNASAMEAAHVIPRARRGADNTRNSLCLCSLHHWAFDKGFWTIDESFQVIVARQIIDLDESDSPIARYHGNRIHVADTTIISVDAIEWHRKNVFLDE